MNICVIGAGSWGTTLSELLAGNGHRVTLWAREPEVADGIRKNRRNPFFVKELELSPLITVSSDIEFVISSADAAVFAVPSTHLRSVLRLVRDKLRAKIRGIVDVAKGLEPVTGKRLSQIFLEELGIGENSSRDMIAVLSGPNLANEVAAGKIGASVIGCPDPEWGRKMQEAFSNRTFRVYRHSDRIGVELGGTLKNIFAIGAGIVDTLDLGDNAKAAYLTRSLHEMVRLGTNLGGRSSTFYGLSGLGDLMATASSPLSRNYQLGQALCRNETLESLSNRTRMVFEGVETARMAFEWGKKLTIPLPITEEICRVLFEKLPPEEAAKNLMSRSLKDEED